MRAEINVHEHHQMTHSEHDKVCEVCGMVNCTMDHCGHDTHDHSSHAGHDHSHHDPAVFKRQFWFALALTIPAIVFSHTVQMLFGVMWHPFAYSEYIPAVSGTILFFTGGLVFLKSGWQEIKSRQPGMMALIAMALMVAFGYSATLTILQLSGLSISSGSAMDFWWELASLVTIMLLGHWIEMSSVMAAQASMSSLAALMPDKAIRINANQNQTVLVSELKVGDTVLVKPGASVPADGVVIQGKSRINESMVTGESAEVDKVAGDRVIAGTINASGRGKTVGALTVRITATGDQLLISGIMRLVEEAQVSKSRAQVLADRAAGWLFYFALASAVITAVVWVLIGSHSASWIVERVVTVLVIACPHALGLAIPLVTAITTQRAARAGLLIRSRLDFENARNTKMVLFDKTGTLTTGKRTLLKVALTRGSEISSQEDLLRLAAAVEENSEHIIGQAIAAEAKRQGLTLPAIEKFEAQPGVGVTAEVKGKAVAVGSPAILVQQQGDIHVEDLVAIQAANDAGHTVVVVMVDSKLAGYFEFGDQLRETALTSVRELKSRGIRVGIVTGDAAGVANAIASELGISEVFAEVLPAQKSELVKRQQASGVTVAFVGDGVNDAPALAQADLGLAIGAGTDVAVESAGLVLVNSDPMSIVSAIDLSKRSVSKMRQNLAWGAAYNVIAVPLAAGASATFGVELSPALGAVLMSLSTIIVAANAQLLRR